MRRPRAFLLPTLLLACATLAMASFVYALLWQETQRIQEGALEAAQDQARIVAENAGLTVAEAKTALQQALLTFQGPNLDRQLEAWQHAEELVSFAFQWQRSQPGTVNVFTDAKSPIDAKTLLRNSAGVWIWDASEKLELSSFADEDISLKDAPSSNYASNSQSRQSIREQSQSSSKVAKERTDKIKRFEFGSMDWIQRRVDDRYVLIGFAKWNNSSTVTGIGIDLESLRPALASSFPQKGSDLVSSFQIRDERGIAFASWPTLWTSKVDPANLIDTLPLGSDLPGWTLQVFGKENGLASIALSPTGIAASLIFATLLGAALWLATQTRTSQLDAARKVDFVANVSHELKTPLTTIRMFSELLRSGRVRDEEKRATYLETISAESRRLARMVNNLLDFSQLERGQAAVKPIEQAIVPVLERYLEMRREDIDRAGFELEIDLGANPESQAVFDSDALAQVLGNLIDNALKYATSGDRIQIMLTESSDHIALHVSDNGPGLPTQLSKGRFKPFERGDTSLKTEVSGFGLGLSIAQSLIEAMGGSLAYLKSRDEPGARFIITLPRT